MLLAVDDLHWADAPSVRALNYLAGRIAELPVLIVVALRPGESTGVADLIRPLHVVSRRRTAGAHRARRGQRRLARAREHPGRRR